MSDPVTMDTSHVASSLIRTNSHILSVNPFFSAIGRDNEGRSPLPSRNYQWAVRYGSSSAVRIFIKCVPPRENPAFQDAEREAWLWVHNTLPQVKATHSERRHQKWKGFVGSLENLVALLQRSGFVNEDDEKDCFR